MVLYRVRSLLLFTVFLLGFGNGAAVFAAVSQGFIDSTDAAIEILRKRDCSIVVTMDGQPYASKQVAITQVKSDFGFGGSILRASFGEDSARYAEVFQRYFEWATPENDMKWTETDAMDDYTDFRAADWLVEWCQSHSIKIRGHNLFWNEHTDWLPSWTLELDQAGFRAAMRRRIDSAMTHFNGKVAHWDIINEIIHGRGNTTPDTTMLDSATGDPDIFKWILEEARKIDTTAKFVINEYAVVEYFSHHAIFIQKMYNLLETGAPVDIVGLEGHFGDVVDKNNIQEKLDVIYEYLKRPMWLTEVDFSVDTLERADRMEELMRTCFAHPHVGGIILWIWWEGRRWRPQLTSFLVDSSFTENELGARWREIREKWRTCTTGTTDASGLASFRGFHGEYVIKTMAGEKVYLDTIYLEPGEGAKAVSVNLHEEGTPRAEVAYPNSSDKMIPIMKSGNIILCRFAGASRNPVVFSTYSLSGRLLTRVQVPVRNGIVKLPDAPAGCQVFRIETAGKILYTGMNVCVR